MSKSSELRAFLLAAVPALAACSQTVGNSDAAAPDAVDAFAPDAVVDVIADVAVDTGADARPDAPLCSFGTAQRECLTQAQVEARIRNPIGEVPRDASADVALDVPVATNGCYAAAAVTDSCCNRAVLVEREGDTCCYTFCTGACCGRPFAIDGGARVATLREDDAWCAQTDGVASLDVVTRDALAAAWRRDALMEHASIASFARFTLHLMALGAPPALVVDTQRAALDEVDHARSCFEIATRIDGRTLGPGALDVRGALTDATIAEAVRAAVLEGCVGETCAALVAQSRRDAARDPVVRDALDRIARDEAHHAALAWRFVAWAIATRSREARASAERAFRDARSIAAPGELPGGVDVAAWRAFGMLAPSEEHAAMRAAIDEVITPCARALFDGAPRGESAVSAVMS